MNVNTYLSPNVHHMVCGITEEHLMKKEPMLLQEKLLLDEQISEALEIIFKDNNLASRLDFENALVKTLPLAEQIHEVHKKLQDKSLILQNKVLSSWLSRYAGTVFSEALELPANSGEKMLLLLELTASLERALGDVLTSSGRPCPFLLRDLLSVEHLQLVFGDLNMKVLKILIGSPLGLNLRNLAWHGFLAPAEIPNIFFSLLIFVCGRLACRLQEKDLIGKISHRSVITESFSLSLLGSEFTDTTVYTEPEKLLALVHESKIISAKMIPCFAKAFALLNAGRYGDCVILLLPCLENILRSVFCLCNGCEHRILTAESTVLYTTMDEILSETIDSGRENKIALILGHPLMVLLYDLFVMLDGPRLRDRISHCEMAAEIISTQIAGLVTHIVIHAAFSYHLYDRQRDQENLKYSNPNFKSLDCSMDLSCASRLEELSSQKESSNFSPNDLRWSELSTSCQQFICSFEQKLDSYNSLFHPICVVARIGRSCINKLSQLRSIVYPSEFVTELGCFETNTQHSYFIPWFASLDKDPDKYFENTVVNNVQKLDKNQQEILVVLRHLATECYEASCNIVSFAQQRWIAYGKRKLRSRQRNNYKSFISKLPKIDLLFLHVLEMLSNRLLNTLRSTDKQTTILIRDLKGWLKLSENLRTLTSKNKWEEILHLRCDSDSSPGRLPVQNYTTGNKQGIPKWMSARF